ncbi:hypothetical protein M0R45_001813 [Rubus argutus]|uniref:Uncharacterized protein n=1 Tax=Rubus argutus TaxID=59490 RepID=A0AAW1VJ20_RUBAR
MSKKKNSKGSMEDLVTTMSKNNNKGFDGSGSEQIGSNTVHAHKKFPQEQTKEHLAAVEIMSLKHNIILQNKVDLVQKSEAIKTAKGDEGVVLGHRRLKMQPLCGLLLSSDRSGRSSSRQISCWNLRDLQAPMPDADADEGHRLCTS